jgi:hypothetical protein
MKTCDSTERLSCGNMVWRDYVRPLALTNYYVSSMLKIKKLNKNVLSLQFIFNIEMPLNKKVSFHVDFRSH